MSTTRELDLAFQKSDAGNMVKTDKYREVLKGSEGHLPGYYMASAIRENGSLNEIIVDFANPVKFIKVYNRIADKDETRLNKFSRLTMEYTELWEGSYLGKKR